MLIAAADIAVTKPLAFTVAVKVFDALPKLPTLLFTVDSVKAELTLVEPSKDTDHAPSPVRAIVLALASLVAVDALPVIVPSTFAINVPTFTIVAVAPGLVVALPNLNLGADAEEDSVAS